MTDSAPASRLSLAFLTLAAVAGAGTALLVSGFLGEYGTTSGSLLKGATDALTTGFPPLFVAVVLAGAAFVTGRRFPWIRRTSLVVAVLSVAGLMAGGAQAAASKYDRLPESPTCDSRGFPSPIKAMMERVQDAATELNHPDRFSGGGSTGYDGCTDHLLNVSVDQAADRYRRELTATGWVITTDDPTRLEARRGGLVFRLCRSRHGEVLVHIGPTPAAARRILDRLGAP